MKRSAVPMFLYAGLVAGLAGCQSGPRWAWWTPWKTSQETAVADRSAAPTLPSASAAPQAVAATGLQPAASPSSTNLAATASSPAAPPMGVQPATPRTIENAPLAAYPTAGIPSAGEFAPPNSLGGAQTTAGTGSPFGTPPAASAFAASAATVSPSTPPLASVPASGPYDPNGYRPSASLAAAQANTGGAASRVANPDGSASADRYALPSYGSTPLAPASVATAPSVATPVDRYAMPGGTTAPVPDAATPVDRYAATPAEQPFPSAASVNTPSPTPANLAGIPATGIANPAAPPAPNGAPVAVAAPAYSMSAENAASEPSPSATVQIKSPPGQYRPGGTSTYPRGAGDGRIEVAARPSPPAAAPSPVQATSPSVSDPWAPPAANPPRAGTRAY